MNEYSVTITRRKLRNYRIFAAIFAALSIGQWVYFTYLADSLQAKLQVSGNVR